MRLERYGNGLNSHLARGLVYWDMRTTKGPSASQSDIHAHPQSHGLGGRKAQSIDVFAREIGQIVEAGLRVVQGKRIQGGDLNPAYAGRFHLFEFALDLRFRDPRAEPPPAHHNAGVSGWMCEGFHEFSQSWVRLGKHRWSS